LGGTRAAEHVNEYAKLADTTAIESAEAGVYFIGGEFGPIAEAKISILDWGFLRNDTCYDTVTAWKGAFFRLDDHIERFMKSAAGLRMTCPYSPAEVRDILTAVVRRSGIRDAYVQAILTRGRPPLGSRDPRLAEPRFHAYAIPYVWIATPEVRQRGLNMVISDIPRIPPESVNPNFKNFSWLDMDRALMEAYDKGGETVVLVDFDGNITEGPGFNIFFVEGGVVTTPDRGVLEGITRRTVFELCAETNVDCRMGKIAAGAAPEADEIFISSSAGGVMPVTIIDGKPVADGAPGPLTRRLTVRYWQKREAGWYATPIDYD
jgi:branched-chain amino acid aminotransferase